MVEKSKENISALMDGDVSRDEMQAFIRELRQDPEQRECWEHYHLIGDAMRNALPPKVDASFAQRVSAAIAEEERPEPVATDDQPAPAGVGTVANTSHGIARPAAGFAVAASVAAVAYLGFGMVSVDEQLAGDYMAQKAPQAQNVIVSNMPAASGLQLAQDVRRSEHQWSIARPAVETRLNNYLYNHQNHSNQAQINTRMMPNARIVIHSVQHDQ